MDDNRQDLFVAAFALWSVLLWLVTLDQPLVFITLLAAPLGAAAVFGFIRWLNHCHDPRYARRPPEAP
jgi:hypothetical protein